MDAKTPKKVDFERLADALTGYQSAYLVTVDDDFRVRTVDVQPELHEQVIEVGLIGGRTWRNILKHRAVTLLWPPSEPGGYSLIVDGVSQLAEISDSVDDTAALRVTPTRALLHRKADPAADGVRHDCVVFTEPQ